MGMDLELDIQCRKCGLLFVQGFREMPHGRMLKCPFCSSTALDLKEQHLVECETESDIFELSVGDRMVAHKIKL